MIILTAEHQVNSGLKISVNAESREDLTALHDEAPDRFGTNDTMYEIFESLLANSDLEWITPEECGALTDAPLIGTLGEAVAIPLDSDDFCGRIAGQWHDSDGILRKWCEPVDTVYGFMDYQLRTPQEDLLAKGYCFFQGGE